MRHQDTNYFSKLNNVKEKIYEFYYRGKYLIIKYLYK